jgi:hypothetical protein
MRRIASGTVFYTAFRDHAYQHGALHHKSHMAIVALIDLPNRFVGCLLLPGTQRGGHT